MLETKGRGNNRMKITRKQLRRIIKEEKRKLHESDVEGFKPWASGDRDPRLEDPGGSISGGDDDERYDLLATVELQLNELLDHIISESERIGGEFKGPGIKREAFRLMADMINSFKR
jgi:hypothetical protein